MEALEIPPGVVATPTKKMNTANWAEANLVRWVEGSLVPVGGQERYPFTFASRCKKIHSWFDLSGIKHTAYLCEGHCYVDTAGTLVDISPAVALTPPSNDLTGGGYGDGAYGAETYGTPRSGGSGVDRRKKITDVYSMDNWGAELRVMTSADGRYLRWDPAASGGTTKLTVVSGSPSVGRFFVITQERFVIMFGINGEQNHWGWCDQENDGDWNFASLTNKAGDYYQQPSSPFICAISGKYGVVAFTAKKAYSIQFIGMPFVYNATEAGDEVAPWSPQSIASTESQAFWVADSGPWSFDGTTITPMKCPVRDWVNDDVDGVTVRIEAAATVVGDFSEFWWFFPQNGQRYNTRAIIYNYKEGWWSQARMARSAGMTGSYVNFPIMANGVKAYQHESGVEYPDVVEYPWIETYALNISKGGSLTTMRQLAPDIEGDSSMISFYLYGNMNRNDKTTEKLYGPFKVRRGGFVDFPNKKARDWRIRIAADGPSVPPFTIGQNQIDAIFGGQY